MDKMKKLIVIYVLILVLASLALAQTEKVTFEKVTLTDIGTISIPSIMELQSGISKQISDKVTSEGMAKLGYEFSGDTIIFQQKGINELKKTNTYARVMIHTDIGNKGDYRKLTSKLTLTKQQLKELDAQTQVEMEKTQAIGMKILRWDGVSIDAVNGRSALKIAYLRQMNNNLPVYVEMFQIENYDRAYTLTISYREQDASIWKEVLATVKNSFTVTNIK